MAKDILRDLFDHMEWADARVWDAALRTPEARGDDALKWLMLHLHGVQQAFLDAWTNQPFAFRNDYTGTTLEAELAAVRAYYPSGRSFLQAVSDPQLAAPILLPWSQWIEQAIGRTPGPITLGETIVQVLTHSGHHRAQANARLRALGAEPPLIDYIGWLWLERPAPAWPFDSLTLAQGKAEVVAS
jgi:uncharacterized damage-inducible protein DinB